MKLWADMTIHERLGYLRVFGGRDDFVRFVIDHPRLPSLHSIDHEGLWDSILDFVEILHEKWIAAGRAIERQAAFASLLDSEPSPGQALQ